MIKAYARTITVATRCRLCGERNPADMPVVRVYSPQSSKVSSRYYCIFCYRALEQVAVGAIPSLLVGSGEQAGQQLAVLLGVDTGRASTEPVHDTDLRNTTLDTELDFPEDVVIRGVPFARFYEEALNVRTSRSDRQDSVAEKSQNGC